MLFLTFENDGNLMIYECKMSHPILLPELFKAVVTNTAVPILISIASEAILRSALPCQSRGTLNHDPSSFS